MNKFFAKKQKDLTFSFYDNDINHILNVLRLTINDKIIVFFDSKKYICKIINLSPLLAMILEEIPNNSELDETKITVFQAIIKPKNFELVLTKATELGANYFYPVIFNRTQFNNIEKHDRYEKIIYAACKQCGRTNIPKINPKISFKDMMSLFIDYDYVVVANEYDSNSSNDLLSYLLESNINNNTNIAIVVGPEGGFSDDELKTLSNIKNINFVGLTKSILKSETATCYMLSILVSYFIHKGNQ